MKFEFQRKVEVMRNFFWFVLEGAALLFVLGCQPVLQAMIRGIERATRRLVRIHGWAATRLEARAARQAARI